MQLKIFWVIIRQSIIIKIKTKSRSYFLNINFKAINIKKKRKAYVLLVGNRILFGYKFLIYLIKWKEKFSLVLT